MLIKREDKYYETITSFEDVGMNFEKVHDRWFGCFTYILEKFNTGFNKDSIKSLFYDFDMENWRTMHLENTEYKDKSKQELFESFAGECWYTSDRMSYDRLFRTHWLFRKAFHDELTRYRYPRLYTDDLK